MTVKTIVPMKTVKPIVPMKTVDTVETVVPMVVFYQIFY
jgi:hypothetical protein